MSPSNQISKPRISLRDKVRYKIDQVFSGGSGVQLFFLMILTLLMILIGGALFMAIGAQPAEGEGPFWWALMRVLDPGNLAGDYGILLRIISMLVTMGGLIFFGLLIGIFSSQLEEKLAELKKGLSPVVEKDFVLILGWNSKIFSLIRELIDARAGKRQVFVVFSNKPTEEMSDLLHDKIDIPKKVTLVCRTGDTIDMGDLAKLNFHLARSVILLAEESEGVDREQADARIIKTLMALGNHPTIPLDEQTNVVAEINGSHNAAIAQIASNGKAEIILTRVVISRLIAQTSRQSGLSYVYENILTFAGDEIYIKHFPAITGQPFQECFRFFEHSTPLGIKTYSSGLPKIMLNPPADYELKEKDELILIARDEQVRALGSPIKYEKIKQEHSADSKRELKPERHLFIGFNPYAFLIINEMDDYAEAGSEVVLLAPDADNRRRKAIENSAGKLKNISLKFCEGNFTDRQTLEEQALVDFNSIILLADDSGTAEEADAKTIITLLLLRDIQRNNFPDRNMKITSEILDARNKALVEITQVNDIIISNEIISLMLAQVACQPELNAIYSEITQAEGAEMYLKPAQYYLPPGDYSFPAIVRAARLRNENALGVRIMSEKDDANFGVYINPTRDKVFKMTADDQVVVLSERED
jgi:Castor and Pollux protein voltage-gated ion channel component